MAILYSEKDKEKYIEVYISKNMNMTEACRATGISRETVRNWLKEDGFFKSLFEDARQQDIDDALSMHKLLRQGIPIYDNDEIIGWIEKPDRQAIEKFLKAQKVEGWEDVKKVDANVNKTGGDNFLVVVGGCDTKLANSEAEIDESGIDELAREILGGEHDT